MEHKKITLIIEDKTINKDDMLLTFSEINWSSKETYKDLLKYTFKMIFKKDINFSKGMRELNNLLLENRYSLKLIYLNKYSKILKKDIPEKTWIKNACIVAKFEKIILNNINTLSFFVDINVVKNDEINFYLRRIEYDNNNLEIKAKENNLKIQLTLDKETTTPIYWIKNLIKNSDKYFDDDDYNLDTDKLQLIKWDEIISILQEMYQTNENHLKNEFFKFENKTFLASISNFSNNEKNLVITVNDEVVEGSNIKEIEMESTKNILEEINDKSNQLAGENAKLKDDKKTFIKSIGKYNVEISNQINTKVEIEKEISKINDSLELKNKEISILNSTVSKYNNEKRNLQKENDILKKDIKKIQLDIDSINNNLSIKEEEKKLIEENIKNNELNIDRCQKQINKIEVDLNKNQEFISNLQNSYNSLREYNNFYVINNIIFEDDDKVPFDENDLNDVRETSELKIRIDRNNTANAKKVQRYYHAIRQLNSGYYKNFNLFNSIKTPSIINDFKFLVPDDVIKKYSLNNKQLSSVNKAINVNDIFYLQGPPGTGKTQTLCAICESVIKKGDNLLMCSSTHEAINNFLERLSDNNRDNPNVIIFKYKFLSTNQDVKKNKDERFSEKELFFNFKDCIYNFLISNNDKKGVLEKYCNNYGTIIPKTRKTDFYLSFINKIYDNFDFFKNKISSFKLFNDEGEFKFPFDEIYEINSIELNDIKKVKNKILDFYKFLEKKDQELYKQIVLFDNVIDNFINLENINLLFDRENIIKNLSKLLNDDRDIITSKISKIKKKYSNNTYDPLETKFLDYIFDNNLINVIGVTTSSRQSISINNRSKNLFSNYNIETMLIDEISKSSTPEILAKAVLSKKIILSGDYRQLPPSPEFCSDFELMQLKEFIKNTNSEKLFEKNETYKKWKSLIDNEDWEKNIKKDFINLFKISFFVTQVNKLKQLTSKENASYEFLQESRRFSGKILELVNIIYDRDEKLIKVYDNNKKFNLVIDGKKLDNELVIVDTSNIDNKYFKKYHNCNIEFEESFDQKNSHFDLKIGSINFIPTSLYNQYSALVIVDVIKKLLEFNYNKFEGVNNEEINRIGVITLTKSQKKLVKEYVNKFIDKKLIKFIKVDTIDNFQGREEEVIIVDFIRGKNNIVSRKLEIKNSRNLSFLEEVERINVAISRAKSKLILVGAFKEYLNNLKINEYGNLFKKYYDTIDESDDGYIKYIGGE